MKQGYAIRHHFQWAEQSAPNSQLNAKSHSRVQCALGNRSFANQSSLVVRIIAPKSILGL